MVFSIRRATKALALSIAIFGTIIIPHDAALDDTNIGAIPTSPSSSYGESKPPPNDDYPRPDTDDTFAAFSSSGQIPNVDNGGTPPNVDDAIGTAVDYPSTIPEAEAQGLKLIEELLVTGTDRSRLLRHRKSFGNLPADPKSVTLRPRTQIKPTADAQFPVIPSWNDPVTFNNGNDDIFHSQTKRVKEMSHEQDTICIAKVNDGDINSASVVEENGSFDLSLPRDHETKIDIECTEYARIQPADEDGDERNVNNNYESPVSGTYTHEGFVKQGGEHEPQNCHAKYFRPGYFDKQTSTWHDHCTGRWVDVSAARARYDEKSGLESPLTKNNCPYVARKKDPIWISFIGDSVTRQIYTQGLEERGFKLKHQTWKGPMFFLAQVIIDDDSEEKTSPPQEVWLSYRFAFVSEGKMDGTWWQIPYTWGDFMEQRGEGPRDDDPNFPISKIPDIVFFSPGYRASVMNAAAYGSITERLLDQWQATLDVYYNAPMPEVHLMLNMMPAPWMIPNKYAWDRTYRTLLNEYRKNLALVEVANKFDFVKSVVDFFSIELPFNGEPGMTTAHKDAVHLGDHRVLHIAGDRVIEAICNPADFSPQE